MPTAADFRMEMYRMIYAAMQEERETVEINSGELHRRVGGYPGANHRMPVCCQVMHGAYAADVGDMILEEPPSGQGASLTISFNQMKPPTERQQEYLDKAAYYVGRAQLCYALELWPEAANHFGSAMESLLRIRYGKSGKLAGLVEKFDGDALFNNMHMLDGAGPQCTTCFADRARILRNSVHPDCWVEATQKEVDETSR